MLRSSSVLAKTLNMLLISDSSPTSSYSSILIQAPCSFITLSKSFSMALHVIGTEQTRWPEGQVVLCCRMRLSTSRPMPHL